MIEKMTLPILNSVIKPNAKAVGNSRVLITDDSNYISNGFVLFNRKFYYVPRLEKEVTLNKHNEVDTKIIDRALNADKTVTLSNSIEVEFDLARVNVNEDLNISLDARKLSTFVQYLLPEYKEFNLELKVREDDKALITIWHGDNLFGCLAGLSN